jgi:hypothetical protein
VAFRGSKEGKKRKDNKMIFLTLFALFVLFASLQPSAKAAMASAAATNNNDER